MAIASAHPRLEDRILARDQIGASAALYDLMKQKRPVTEILAQTVRIHAPYTHVPYHQRLDDGVVKFVNNDHCLLGERVALPLMSMVRPELSLLPLAQVVWYIPTGLDPWNQLLGKAPGHYTRLYEIKVDQAPPRPEAHHALYAGVRAMAVGPRWYSTYEMGCNIVQNLLDGRDADLLRQEAPLTPAEEAMLVDTITRQREWSVIEAMVALLKAGRGPRRILDAIQVASAQVILETGAPNNFSMSQHGYEYCNTLGWFYDTFEHPHRLKLLFVAASFVNRAAEHQANTPDNGRRAITPPPGADALGSGPLLERLEATLLALRPDEAVAVTATYLKAGFDRTPLVETLASAAAKIGNDPHNQELGLCLLEDYLRSTAADRERLLLACAQHTAGHRKYGDHLESYRRFAEALGLS